MEAYNQENDADLVPGTPVDDAKVGYYSRQYGSIDEIPEGARVAIPNDHSNEGRALAILDEHGLITMLDDAVMLEETVDNRFSISLVARGDNADSAKLYVLEEAITSDEVRDFLEEEHSLTLLPAFCAAYF